MVFPITEQYWAELWASHYRRLDDAATARLPQAYADTAHSNAIEAIHATPERAELFDMFVEERAPPAVTDAIVDRYGRDHVLTPADTAAAE